MYKKPTKFSDHIVPPLCRAGDPRVLVNGRPLSVDFRIIAEEEYQLLVTLLREKEYAM